MHLLETLLTWAQLAILVPLAAFGLHRGWMVLLFLRTRRRADAPLREPAPELPTVTVQLPVYNERYVAARLIEAAADLDYPRDRLEIQVLDDSSDDTSEIIATCVQSLPADVRIEHVYRTDRVNFKAGALAHGLERSSGELVAVFDADFVPPRQFLRATVPQFADPAVGMVQCRWDHLNTDYSLLTRMQALLLDGHFAIEHVARSRSGCYFNFNGTAGVFRRSCIADAGGWQGDTLTEDMDLSYRAQLAGWRFRYLPDVACPAELPVQMNAFLNQQFRWAKGSIQTARKLLPTIRRAKVGAMVKVEATFHLLGNLCFPLLLGLILLTLPLQSLRLWHETIVPTWLAWVEGLPLLLSTFCVLLYYGVAQRALRRPAGIGTWLRIPLVLAIGAGLCVNNTIAVLSAVVGPTGEFRRTPKWNVVGGASPIRAHIYGSRRGQTALLEIALGIWAAGNCVLSLLVGLPVTAAFHALFAAGLLWVGASSLLADRPASTDAVGVRSDTTPPHAGRPLRAV